MWPDRPVRQIELSYRTDWKSIPGLLKKLTNMGSGGFLGTVTIPVVSVILYSMEPKGRFIVTPGTNTERRGHTVHIALFSGL